MAIIVSKKEKFKLNLKGNNASGFSTVIVLITFAINTAFFDYLATMPAFHNKHVFKDTSSFLLLENITIILTNFKFEYILICII